MSYTLKLCSYISITSQFKKKKRKELDQAYVQILALLLTNWGTLGKSLNLSELQGFFFPFKSRIVIGTSQVVITI